MHAPAQRQATGRRRWLLLLLLLASTALLTLYLPGRAEAMGTYVRSSTREAVLNLLNRWAGPPRVGLQIGHLGSHEHPDELARLRTSTGAFVAGILEVEVNEAVARALAERLEARGFVVDLFGATVPPRYRADLVLAVHADSSPDPDRRGYKSAVFRRQRNRWDDQLKDAVDKAYLAGSGLPDDDANVTGNMLGYYAFNSRYRHSLARSTPAVIIELGYLSHPSDRELLIRPHATAELLERGVIDFLRRRGRLVE